MKTIKAYEYKDLDKDLQKKIIDKTTDDIIKIEIEGLSRNLENGLIGEKEYYETLGCDKNYAKTTSWFVPSCYYDKHKEEIDKEAKEEVEKELYNSFAQYIQLK